MYALMRRGRTTGNPWTFREEPLKKTLRKRTGLKGGEMKEQKNRGLAFYPEKDLVEEVRIPVEEAGVHIQEFTSMISGIAYA